MKTLIIDNYDSFTYNLFHLFAAVTGSEPVVIKNDDPNWQPAWLHAFDQVVISPGPGNPAEDVDMGISRMVLKQGEIINPLLGICLGHQGLCFEAGANVVQAPEPVHGRIDIVSHTGDPLFDQIPHTFEVVRYHSLTVTDLPDNLLPIAWTDDGILMAVAHTRLPFWGCQFHPESACTQYGEQLVRNFCNLAAEYNRKTPAMMTPPVAPRVMSDVRFHPKPASPCRRYRLYARPLAVNVNTEMAFTHMYADAERAFWLDSNDPDSDLTRISVMSDVCGPHSRFVVADVHSRRVSVMWPSGECKEFNEQGFFDWLKQDLNDIVLTEEHKYSLPFDVRPGWFGHLGYELKAECGGSRAHRSEQPDAGMLFADRILVFHHAHETAYALALIDETDSGDEALARAWADSVEAALADCPPLTPVSEDAVPRGKELALRHTPKVYLEHIEACQREITRGESYEICLTNQLSFSLQSPPDPLLLYRYLRAQNPTSFSAFIRWPEWSVLSLSPERFMRVNRDHRAESRPMKGTRKRSAYPQEDAALCLDLANNPKDKAENLMIVDLVRNDLGRCAKPCSVFPGPLFQVETYATVHQLVSTIQADLRPEATAVDCVQTAFPGGSMTGAPKIRTLDIIDQLEQGPRGVYSGAIGYFSVNGTADFNIVIRTLVLTGKEVTLASGGAIIALSDPRVELEETAVKSRALLEPFGLQFPLEQANATRLGTEVPSWEPIAPLSIGEKAQFTWQ